METNHFSIIYNDKEEKLNVKEQNFELKDKIRIRVGYDIEKNKSAIIIKEPMGEKIKEIREGLVLLQILTNNGELKQNISVYEAIISKFPK